ncbi:MAG: hypothetical protein ACTSUQ_08240 [Candidatus Freyarchaeota archaeon]
MKVFENGMCALWVYLEFGEPWWFRLIDLRNNRTIHRDFVRNRTRLRRYQHTEDILREFEEWLNERCKERRWLAFPSQDSAPPM